MVLIELSKKRQSDSEYSMRNHSMRKMENQNLRVLLLSVGTLSGHRQAAEAIKQTLKKLYPDAETQNVNLFRYANSFWVCLLDGLYHAILKFVPWFWNLIWDSKEVYWLTYGLRSTLCQLNWFRLYREVIRPFSPHVIICTYSLACAMCAIIKKKKRSDFLLAAASTDFSLNPYWFDNSVDVYFLPHEALRKKLIKKGISPGKLCTVGIPISMNFSEPKNKDDLRKRWQVRKDLFTILLMGGGLGMGSLKEIVVTLDNSHLPIQLLVVTGINRRLKRKLQALESHLNLPIKVFGYIKKIDELMEISDLLISKPGGLTTAESLVKKVPLAIVDSLAGQERRNQQLLSERGITFELKDKEDLIDLIRGFLNNSFDLTQWQHGVSSLARPQATQEIVEKLVSLTKEKKDDSRISGSTH